MPIVVDHAERRKQVAEVTADLIAAHGVERLTVRAVAAATGFSTTVVSHYFRDKRELLLHAYRFATTQASARVAAAGGRGATRLRRALEAILPLDAERRAAWQIWFAFWGVAIADAEFTAEQRRRARDAQALFETLVRDALPAGAGRRPSAVTTRTEELLTVAYGIAAQAVFDPASWPATRQLRLLQAALEAPSRAFRHRRKRAPD